VTIKTLLGRWGLDFSGDNSSLGHASGGGGSLGRDRWRSRGSAAVPPRGERPAALPQDRVTMTLPRHSDNSDHGRRGLLQWSREARSSPAIAATRGVCGSGVLR
jgi:hypothetical protein